METVLDLSPFDKVADLYTLGHVDMPLLRLAWQLSTGPAVMNLLVVDRTREYQPVVSKLFAFCKEMKPMLGYQETEMLGASLYWIRRQRPRARKESLTQLLAMNLDSPAINGQEIAGHVYLWYIANDMVDGPHLPGAFISRIIPALTTEATVFRVR